MTSVGAHQIKTNGSGYEAGLTTVTFPDSAGDERALWPELRVVREAEIGPMPGVPEWDNFLSTLGRENRGKGKAYSLGSIAVTLVSAQELGQMLQAKEPATFRNRRRTLQAFRSMQIRIDSRVDRNEELGLRASRDHFDMVDELRSAQQDEPEALFLDLEEAVCSSDDAPVTVPAESLWTGGYFTCNDLNKYSRDGLGVDLSANRALREERSELIDMFQGMGLDTGKMDSKWQPHIVVLETFSNIGKTVLTAPEHPSCIYLERPKAMINDNSPT